MIYVVNKMAKKYVTVLLTKEVCDKIKEIGKMGDSYNMVLEKVLKIK